jgi:hypothetical protein
MRPGFKTSEFWQALVAQALALCALLGLVNAKDTEGLQDTLGKCITGIFALAANTFVVISYIRTRFNLKALAATKEDNPGSADQGPGFTVPGTTAADREPRVTLPLKPTCWLLLGAGLFLLGSPLQAQSIFPWRNGILQQVRDHDQKISQLLAQQGQQHPPAPAPQQPQVIVIPQAPTQPPLQTFPIQGKPEQTFPIQGQPQQILPIQGQPKQDFPIQGQPQQQLPIQGPPKQDLPIQGQPQPLPIMPPAASQGPHVYSIQRALHTPID